MKKVFLLLLLTISLNALSQNAVFPIINTYSNGYPEFVAANISKSVSYNSKTVYVVDAMQMWCGSECYNTIDGQFLSFSYVSRTVYAVNSIWYHGGESTQVAFHPGGQSGFNYSKWTNGRMDYTPLYAFKLVSGKGLCIVNVWDGKTVSVIDSSTDVEDYTSLTVFAGSSFIDSDIIVVSGKNLFKVFETIPNNASGIRQVSSTEKESSYFGINGQKHGSPQRGVNIVADGDSVKKILAR